MSYFPTEKNVQAGVYFPIEKNVQVGVYFPTEKNVQTAVYFPIEKKGRASVCSSAVVIFQTQRADQGQTKNNKQKRQNNCTRINLALYG